MSKPVVSENAPPEGPLWIVPVVWSRVTNYTGEFVVQASTKEGARTRAEALVAENRGEIHNINESEGDFIEPVEVGTLEEVEPFYD